MGKITILNSLNREKIVFSSDCRLSNWLSGENHQKITIFKQNTLIFGQKKGIYSIYIMVLGNILDLNQFFVEKTFNEKFFWEFPSKIPN